jgi:putative ABC transport system permease protein
MRRLRTALSRAVGAAGGSTLALTLLVCGCVFAALAGPALSLHTRSQAFEQTMGPLGDTTKAVQVSASLGDFTGAYGGIGGAGQDITPRQLAESTSELAAGFAALPLPLGPGQWSGLTTKLLVTAGAGARAQAQAPPELEMIYRPLLTGNARLAAGTYASTGVPRGYLPVAATTQVAARFGLRPGTRLTEAALGGPIHLYVTAILRESAPGSTFWMQDIIAGTPELNSPTNRPYWVGGVFADPGQLVALENAFNGQGMELNWEYPLALGGVNANQAQGLDNALTRATTVTPGLTGALEPSNNAVTVSSGLISPLSQFLSTQAAVETVLLLLFVSLIVVGAAVILLAGTMMVARRTGELTTLRARGGSVRQVAAVMLRAAAIAAVPAALVGVGLAIGLVPDGAVPSVPGWSLAAIALIAALAGPPLIAAWQFRTAAPASNPALLPGPRAGKAWRRPVAEITACAAAVAGLIVLHNQGLPANGGINLYLTITPVLVALPVVLIMLRLYPLVVRGLLRASARGSGATGFIALSSAARSSLTGVLPAFALVLALSLATFAGMVSGGISRGEVAASWQATGADVLITTGPDSPAVGTAAVRAIGAVRGVSHATAIWNTNWVTPGGQPLTVVAVDPASYAAVTAGTPFPGFPAAKIGTATGRTVPPGAAVPVLASPAAASMLGTGATQLNSLYPIGPFSVRVAGTLGSTPAQPGVGAFVVMPLDILPGLYGQPAPNMVLATGSSIDQAQLAAVANKVIPDNFTTFRTSVLASLAGSPLQHGAVLVIDLTIAAAAAFGLFIVILGLALGAADRELTLARLTVMGHERPTRLVLAEVMPAVLAAIVAGALCAVALPHVVGSSINLSAFTGSNASVQFSPDVTAVGLPAVAIALLALATLIAEIRALRRRSPTGLLRAN